MKKIIKHYPMTDRLIVRREYIKKNMEKYFCKKKTHTAQKIDL